jgi:chemotaxis protein methyltransferase CheR
LRWALPRLGKRWTGFRPVQQQVCRCLVDRLTTLDLRSFDAYRDYLREHPDEWETVDACSRITISRFYRGAPVFDRLRADELPRLMARAHGTLRCWSAGAASGEEAYTLVLLWHQAVQPGDGTQRLRILATDAQTHMLGRAATAVYEGGSLKELPAPLVRLAFDRAAGPDGLCYSLKPRFRAPVQLALHDVRTPPPTQPFHLICCRYVLMYFDAEVRRHCLAHLTDRLLPGGVLVLGTRDLEPPPDLPLLPINRALRLYRRE